MVMSQRSTCSCTRCICANAIPAPFLLPLSIFCISCLVLAVHCGQKKCFFAFPCRFLNPNFFPIWILIYKRWEICRNKLKMHSVTINCPELPQLAWISCSSDLKKFANSRPSASNFIRIFQSLNHFFLTVGQNNFGNKIPFLFSAD